MNTLLLRFFHPPVPDHIAGRFDFVIAALRYIIFHFVGRSHPPELVCLISKRVGRLGLRFASLHARYQAGTLRPPRPRAAPRTPRPRNPRPLDRLPRKTGWLADMFPGQGPADARGLAEHLRNDIDNNPETQAFLAAAPQAGRILRPLWRMLTPAPLPEKLKLPRKPEAPSEGPPAQPSSTSSAACEPLPSADLSAPSVPRRSAGMRARTVSGSVPVSPVPT